MFCSSRPPCTRKKKKEGTKQAAGPSLEETDEKAWISPPFLVLEPRSLPPLLENRICYALLLTAGCSCLWRANCLGFGFPLEFPLQMPPALPPNCSPVVLGKLWFPIVLSVSTEIEFSILWSECSVLCK
ncbi:hypothetical protein SLEP1_g20101 [Rubroshorea leprosula]|uniref:Uncharacterized protein n=1 Tax=Rubroshorea leprosula TaxID=152421 RepID=A0AAV5J705_9ROSI|nr:hypothetical protein SLEP1_g20101 [Rubroshorea leprosula]